MKERRSLSLSLSLSLYCTPSFYLTYKERRMGFCARDRTPKRSDTGSTHLKGSHTYALVAGGGSSGQLPPMTAPTRQERIDKPEHPLAIGTLLSLILETWDAHPSLACLYLPTTNKCKMHEHHELDVGYYAPKWPELV